MDTFSTRTGLLTRRGALALGSNLVHAIEDEQIERRHLGRRLRAARIATGLTQYQAARSTGIGRTALSQIETGTRGLDSLELRSLALLYQRPVDDFLETTDLSGGPGANPPDPALRSYRR